MYPTLVAMTRATGLLAALLLAGPVPALVLAGPAAAQAQAAGSPGEWFARYTTARTLGMGGAFVAAADDPLGALWNPASSRRWTRTSCASRTRGCSRTPRSTGSASPRPAAGCPASA